MGEPASPLEVRVFSGGPFQQNSYLVQCTATGRAVVVDPGAVTGRIVEVLEGEEVGLDAVWLTHAHLDHVEGLPALRAFADVPIHLHPADRVLYDRAADQAAAFGLSLPGPLPPPDRDLTPGNELSVGAQQFEVRFTPGHAPGHVILVSHEGGVALVGDVVFYGSIGRTDLPGGDFQALISSIRSQVLTLPDEMRLLAGHGPETTVGQERRGNPFLISQAPGGFA